MANGHVVLFLCGDVMLGRGVDQVLPHPGDPQLRESFAADARHYVRMAEATSGPIPRTVPFTWPWGDALSAIEDAGADVRIVNLETSVTTSDDFAPDKPVCYRMHPRNLPALTAVRPDVCALANNHVLDFGRTGLTETLAVLHRAGLRTAGAGRDAAAAWEPAVVPLADGGRVVVYSCGMPSSGVPPDWAATDNRSGVDFAPGAATLVQRAWSDRRPGDIVIASLHWGSNWGYETTPGQVRYAHALIDGGIDLVHGHSSHHPRAVEVYRGKLILYGCGDCVDDYEGIPGYEFYRDDLRPLYFATLRPDTGELTDLAVTVMRATRMRLQYASPSDTAWLADVLTRAGSPFGARFHTTADARLTLAHAAPRPPDNPAPPTPPGS